MQARGIDCLKESFELCWAIRIHLVNQWTVSGLDTSVTSPVLGAGMAEMDLLWTLFSQIPCAMGRARCGHRVERALGHVAGQRKCEGGKEGSKGRGRSG